MSLYESDHNTVGKYGWTGLQGEIQEIQPLL